MKATDVEKHIAEYAQNRRGLYLSFIRRKMRIADQDTAESLFQEALLRCWKNREAVSGDNFAGYFRGVLRNVMLVHHHRSTTKPEHPWDFAGRQQQEEDTRTQPIADIVLMRQLLANLSEEDRRIMIRWAQSERGISVDSSRAHRIRMKLRQEFACHAT